MSDDAIRWLKYAKPVEIDGKWVVTITDTQNPEWEGREEFESVEKADAYIKAQILGAAKAESAAKKREGKRKGNYVGANYEIVELTDEQKAYVRANWKEKDLKTLTQETFNDPTLNGHHTEGKSVKAYIATLTPEGEPAPEIKTTGTKKGFFQLSDPQKASVSSLLNTENPPPTKEIFAMVFPDVKLRNPLIPEYQALCRYIKEVNEESIDIWDEPVESRRYKSPKTYSAMIGMANRYVGNAVDPNKAMYDASNIKPVHERNLKALLSYMQTSKFFLQASQYDKKADRELFESTFVRFVHDKASDLMPEEVDMYISAAAETVQVSQIERTIQRQEKYIDDTLDEPGDSDGSKAKLSMSLVESVNSLREKLDKSKGRLKGLIESVAGSRNKRLDSKSNKDDALVNLIALWVQERSRKDLIALAKKEHAEDAAESDRIESLDDTYALIAGMTKEEAIHGMQ